MEYLLPKFSLELVLFVVPVIAIFLIVLQFGFVHRLDEYTAISQKGFAVALLVLLLSPILIMVHTAMYAIQADLLELYGVDMLFLLIVWSGLFYTLINVSSRIKQLKMIYMQRVSAACSSIFAFMFVGTLFHAS